MNKTPNYNLSQWDLADRIEMKDFNADNAAIEAALTTFAAELAKKALASDLTSRFDSLGSSKLQLDTLLSSSFTATGGTSCVIDMPGNEIGNCVLAAAVLTPTSLSADTFLFNGTNGFGVHYPLSGSGGDGMIALYKDRPTLALLFPIKRPSDHIHGVYFSGREFAYFYNNETYSSVAKMHFRAVGGGSFTGSGTIRIYGVR